MLKYLYLNIYFNIFLKRVSKFMPELPEVETIKNGILKIIDDKVVDVVIRNSNLRYKINKDLSKFCLNKVVKDIYRRGKYLIIRFNKGNLILHFGMTGSLVFINKKLSEIKKHDHVDIVFEKFLLRYNDPRRFGFIKYEEEITNCELLNKLGLEPLSDNFTAEYLFDKIKDKKTKIKQLIMNNEIVVGIGNIYACESLFLSCISPLRSGNAISLRQTRKLVECIKNVLNQAILSGGSTLKDYKKVDGTLGYFQINHKVYGKSGKPCTSCNTTISEIRIGQRNTFYCGVCQI